MTTDEFTLATLNYGAAVREVAELAKMTTDEFTLATALMICSKDYREMKFSSGSITAKNSSAVTSRLDNCSTQA